MPSDSRLTTCAKETLGSGAFIETNSDIKKRWADFDATLSAPTFAPLLLLFLSNVFGFFFGARRCPCFSGCPPDLPFLSSAEIQTRTFQWVVLGQSFFTTETMAANNPVSIRWASWPSSFVSEWAESPNSHTALSPS